MRDGGRQAISTTRGSGADGLRGFAVLVLLALCWAQVALAAHQFEHPASAADDACRVCAQFDRSDDVSVASGAAEPLPACRSCPAATARVRDAAEPSCAPRQRAPPLS